MDNGVEYAEQRADRMGREKDEAEEKILALESFCYEAMNLAVNGGTPTKELWVWWRRQQMKRGLSPYSS